MELNRPHGINAPGSIHGSLSRFVAEKYTSWRVGLPANIGEIPDENSIPAIIAVGGGKGGVGKSVISANLSGTLGRLGMRVLVIDLDFGCANLHTHFGIGMPKRSLTDFLLRKTHSFADVILPAPVDNVNFVAGGREEEWGHHLGENYVVLAPLWQSILMAKKLHAYDAVILDLGAGTHRHTMEFFSAAHLGLVTILPEATSIENAYVFLKMALLKLVEHLGQRLDQKDVAKHIQRGLSQAGTSIENGYLYQLRELKNAYPQFVTQVARSILARYIGIIVNQTREQSDLDIAKSMEHICQRYFGFQTVNLGNLNYDESVWKSSKNRRLLLVDFPHAAISKKFNKLASDAVRLLQFEGV